MVRLARHALVPVLLLATALPLRAAPDTPAPVDAVLQLLHDRGLLPTTAQVQAQARQVRDAASELVTSAP
jgi:hypothetical protein